MQELGVDDPELAATAYHEAGHAVITRWLGRSFRYASIEGDETSSGRVVTHGVGDWFRPDSVVNGRTRRRIEQDGMILLAGHSAEALATGVADFVGAADDYHLTVGLVSYATSGWKETEAYIGWLWERVDAVLAIPAVWEAVEAVAAALLEQRTIEGSAARRLVDVALLAARPSMIKGGVL